MTNRNIIMGAVLSGVVIIGTVAAVACSSMETPDKIDLASTHTTAAQTTAAASEETAAPVTEAAEETTAVLITAENISYELSTYTDGNISIQYPVLSNLGSQEEPVNQLLKDNALSILNAYDTENGDTSIQIKCQVPSITKKRATAIYKGTASVKGAAHPVNVYYTNTVDLTACKDLGLSDFADPYTMAGYVLSDDVQFDGLSGNSLSAALEERKLMDIQYYTQIFEEADFPFDASKTWPSSFCYEKQGEIYFSIPVSHALGDYAIVKFIPETK